MAKATKLIKLFKFAKVTLTAVTMAVSIAAYTPALGWGLSIGLVALLFVHEMGHVIALRKKGIPATAPIFIPFLGAAIFMPKLEDREEEAYVGYGGPLLGLVSILAVLGLWALWPGHPKVLLAAGFLGGYLNLFNMIPARPLDGGRITQTVGPWFLWIGCALLAAIVLLTRNGAYMLVCIIVVLELPIKTKWAFTIGMGLYLAMIGMFFTGHGNQIPIVNSIDIFMGTLLLTGVIYRLYDNIKETRRCRNAYERIAEAIDDAEPYVDAEWAQRQRKFNEGMMTDHVQWLKQWNAPEIPTPSKRPWLWFLRYAVLTEALSVVTIILYHLLESGR